jgi:hypothetical protein
MSDTFSAKLYFRLTKLALNIGIRREKRLAEPENLSRSLQTHQRPAWRA